MSFERSDTAVWATSAFPNNCIADDELAQTWHVLKTKKVQKKEKTVDVIEDVQIEGPFAFGDTGRSDPRTYLSNSINTTVCPSLIRYLAVNLTDESSFEYRAIAEKQNSNENNQVEVFDLIIVGAAAVFRNEPLKEITEFGNWGGEHGKLFSVLGQHKAHEFLKWTVGADSVKRISHVHAFCGNDAVKGVGEPLMKEIKRREARAARDAYGHLPHLPYCLIVLWSLPAAVGFYEKQGFTCVTPSTVNEWKRAFGSKDSPIAPSHDWIQAMGESDIQFCQVFMICIVLANPPNKS